MGSARLALAGDEPPSGPRRASLVVMTGTDVGKRIRLDHRGAFTIGSADGCSLVVPGIHARHITLCWVETAWALRVEAGADSVRVNGTLVESTVLEDGWRIEIGAGVILAFIDDADIRYHELIYELTCTDALTRVFNQRYLSESVEREVRRQTLPLSLLRVAVVGEFPAECRDRLAVAVAGVLRESCERRDLAGRIDGLQFALVLTVDADEARRRGDELLARIREALPANIIISIGISTLGPSASSANELWDASVAAIEAATKAGGNAVHVA